MAEERTYGLKSIKIGDIAEDGGMGNSLTALGRTYKGTASIKQDESEVKDFYCEEEDDPIESYSKAGKIVVEWAQVDFAGSTLERILGGTDGTTYWDAPSSAPQIEQSIEITTDKDMVFAIPRAKISAWIDVALGDEDLGLVRIRATVLVPTKENEPKMTITPAVEEES